MRAALARVLLLLVVPVAAIGPALLPGRRLLPLAPAAFEPLASEAPEASARAWSDANRLAVDGVFPLLDDQLTVRERLLRGELPLWDERLGAGQPFLGGTMAAPFYPPGWPRLLFDEARGHAWSALLALFLAGQGMWLLLARRGLEPGACALGALALQAGGWGLENVHLAPKLDAALWLPWALWAVDGVLARARQAGLCLFGATALPWLAGFPGVAAFGLVTTLAYAVARTFANRARPARLVAAFSFVMLGLGGAAVQLLPTFHASAQSLRGVQDAAAMSAQALPLATTLSIVLPNLFGLPVSDVPASRDALTWWLARASEGDTALAANALEWNLFAGLTVLVLGAAALAARPRRSSFPALLAVAALGFAQGWPGFSLAFHVPALALGAPARAASLAWVAWPWLAAAGMQALLAGERRALAAALGTLGVAGLLALLAVLGFDGERWAGELPGLLAARFGVSPDEVARQVDLEAAGASAVRFGNALSRVVSTCAALVFAFLVILRIGHGRAPRWSWKPLAAVVAFEGLMFGAPHLAPRHLAEGEVLFPSSPSMYALADAADGGRVLRLDGSASGLDDVLALARPNLPHAYGIADLTPYVVFPNRRVVELLGAIDPDSRYRSGASRLSDAALLDHPVLDLLRVRAVLAREPLEHPRLELFHSLPGFHVYRRSGALEPARVVPSAVETPTDDTALGLLAARVVDPRTATVLAPGQDAGPPPAAGVPFDPGVVELERPRPEELRVFLRGTSGGWLVLSEAWAPGWRATIDDRPARIARVDHALRGVHVPPGDSEVRLRYVPAPLRTGALVSLLALVAALVRTRWRDTVP